MDLFAEIESESTTSDYGTQTTAQLHTPEDCAFLSNEGGDWAASRLQQMMCNEEEIMKEESNSQRRDPNSCGQHRCHNNVFKTSKHPAHTIRVRQIHMGRTTLRKYRKGPHEDLSDGTWKCGERRARGATQPPPTARGNHRPHSTRPPA